MPRPKNYVLWTVIGALLSLVLPILGTAIAGLLFPDFLLMHLPLHAVVEGAGGLVALAVAAVLLAEMGRKTEKSHYPCMAAGLTSMGMFDLFHAASTPGNHFVWLHSIATFAGGVFFGLLWISHRVSRFCHSVRFPAVVAIVAIAVSVASITVPSLLPEMKTAEGAFSNSALTLNVCGGLGFLSGAVFFVRRFLATGEAEDWMFAVHTTLFGAAGVLFSYSVVWDAGWWWWHVLRLAAYVAALLYGLRTFRDVERELQHVNRHLNETNCALDRTVEERTAELRAVEERSNLALKSSGVGTWSWDVVKNSIFWDDFIHPLFGLQPGTFPGRYEDFVAMLHVNDRDRVVQEVARSVEENAPFDTEYKVVWPDGSVHVLGSRAKVYRDSAGRPLRMTGVCWDITERKRLEDRFRLAVEASPAALLMVHQDGRILMANSRGLAMFGYTAEEVVGQPIEVLVPPRFRAGHPAHRDSFFNRPVQRAMGAELDLLGVRKDGSEFPVKVGLSPVETAEGQAVICGVIDITDQKKTLEVMRQAREAAESASRAKSSFLANMSHEIRTPMNGIIGMAQLLAQTELRSHQRDYLATVEESAHILLRLLNDILDFSKIEAGKLELECVDFQLSECVARASQMLVLRATEKGLEIACRVAPEIPDHLRGDSGRLQQVLVNLLGNAVKFTEAGEIFVNVNAESITADKVRLHISVSDTGIGIPKDKVEQVFHPFEQAESSTTRRFGGTGLGLPISRQLVEMMHGRLWIDSELGRGSTFHFTAEFGIAADQHRAAPAELDSLRDLPVLVVDDNFTNRRILSEMLQHWHMQPVLADSAAAARQALQAAAASLRPIRLILLDHHMPGEDGIHFAESLHGMQQHGQCPIIMISSGSPPIDVELGQKYGIGRFMTKPVIASELLNEVLHQFGRYTTIKPSLPSTIVTPADVKPRRVLVVEDSETNRRVVLGMLRLRGHTAVVAENGQEAVAILGEQEFDVVLMDMQMPVMDGYEATVAIRARERQTGGHFPIVALTAEALKGDRERCLAAGMDDYVVKPIIAAEMFRAIEQFPAVCLETNTAPWKSPAPTEAIPIDPQRPEVQSNTMPIDHLCEIDWSEVKKRLSEGAIDLCEFSELVKQETRILRNEIRQAIEIRDPKQLRRFAHTLKSSVSYFGVKSLVQAAEAMEEIGRTETFDGIEELIATLELEVARFLAALELGPPNIE